MNLSTKLALSVLFSMTVLFPATGWALPPCSECGNSLPGSAQCSWICQGQCTCSARCSAYLAFGCSACRPECTYPTPQCEPYCDIFPKGSDDQAQGERTACPTSARTVALAPQPVELFALETAAFEPQAGFEEATGPENDVPELRQQTELSVHGRDAAGSLSAPE